VVGINCQVVNHHFNIFYSRWRSIDGITGILETSFVTTYIHTTTPLKVQIMELRIMELDLA